MNLTREAFLSLIGIFRLARFDGRGAAYINATAQGFWRSFFAAILVIPVHFYLIDSAYAEIIPDIGAARFYSIVLIGYVITWVLFPLVMVSMTRALGWWPHFYAYCTARNWSTILSNVVLIFVIAISHNLAGPMADTIMAAALFYVLAFDWYVARRMLAVSGLAAVGVVALDGLLAAFLQITIGGLLWG